MLTETMMEDGEAKRIFRLAPVMRDFLRTCVPLPWARTVTLDQLQLATGEATARHRQAERAPQRRLSDLVWEVQVEPGPDGPRFLVVLMELQRRTDLLMAERIHEYVALQIGERRRAGQGQPPILPVVLHTGFQRWSAPTLLRPAWPEDLVPAELVPSGGYLYVSAGDWPLPQNVDACNLVTEVFRCLQFDGSSDVTRLLDGLMMVAARDGEQWVLDALADPLARLIARRHGLQLPPHPVATMQSLKEEMKTWLYMPGAGEWKEMLDEERQLRRQEQELRRREQELRQQDRARLEQERELRQQERELRQQEQELRQQEQDARRQTLSRAILRLDASATADELEGLSLDQLQERFDRL